MEQNPATVIKSGTSKLLDFEVSSNMHMYDAFDNHIYS